MSDIVDRMEFGPEDDSDSSRRAGIGLVLARSTSWQIAPQVVAWVINIGLTPYFISELGSSRYSILLLISTLLILLGAFDGGLGPSALRYFTLYAGRNDRETTTRLLITVGALFSAFSLAIFAGFLMAAPLALSIFKVEDQYQPESLFLLRTLTVIVYLLTIRTLCSSILFARQRFRITAIASIASFCVYAAGMVLTVERKWGLWGVGYAFVAQQVIASLITFPATIRYLDRHGIGWLKRPELVEFLKYSWKVQIASLIRLFTAQKDQLVAGYLLSAQMSGPYGQGSNFAQQLRQIPYNATSPILALIGSTVGRDGADVALATVVRVQRLWVRGVTGWFAVGIPACYFGIRAWLPPSFEIAGAVGAVLLAGYFFTMAASVLLLWGLTLGHPELDVRYGLVGLVTNISLSLILMPTVGVIGVIFATSISQATSVFFLCWDARRTLATVPPWFVGDIPWLPALLALLITGLVEFGADGVVPKGPIGLVLSALLAVPGLLFYAQVVFGVRTLIQGLGRSR